jgi:hypothetical protein
MNALEREPEKSEIREVGIELRLGIALEIAPPRARLGARQCRKPALIVSRRRPLEHARLEDRGNLDGMAVTTPNIHVCH